MAQRSARLTGVRASLPLRAGLAYLTVVLGVSGAWATFLPADFWENYPGFGIRLVERLPPYNEHLVNDFGTLYLGFAVLFAIAFLRQSGSLIRASLIAFLVYSVPHFVFHVIHLDAYPPPDAHRPSGSGRIARRCTGRPIAAEPSHRRGRAALSLRLSRQRRPRRRGLEVDE